MSAPTVTEWGVRWPADPDEGLAETFEQRDDEGDARRLARQFPTCTVVSRTVTRSPWVES